MGELKPCPFCNAQPVPLSHLKAYEQSTAGRFRCENTADDCPIAGLTMTASEWNTRPRTEGRGEGEPVAWQEAAEPFFRLAREVINPVNGERPWHADSKDWMVVFSFAGQSVTLGDLRRAAVASPIREPLAILNLAPAESK